MLVHDWIVNIGGRKKFFKSMYEMFKETTLLELIKKGVVFGCIREQKYSHSVGPDR